MQTIEATIKAKGPFSEKDRQVLSDAESSFKLAIEEFPGHGRALTMLGMLLERTGRREEAIPFLIRARGLPKDSSDWNTASGVLVNCYFADADAKSSLPILEEIVQHHPKDWDAWFKLGLCVMETEPERAQTAFQTALDLNPSHPDSRNHLSRLQQQSIPDGLQARMQLHQAEVARLTALLQEGKI